MQRIWPFYGHFYNYIYLLVQAWHDTKLKFFSSNPLILNNALHHSATPPIDKGINNLNIENFFHSLITVFL